MWFQNVIEGEWVELKGKNKIKAIAGAIPGDCAASLVFQSHHTGLTIQVMETGDYGDIFEYFLNKKDLTKFIDELTAIRDNITEDVAAPPVDELDDLEMGDDFNFEEVQ